MEVDGCEKYEESKKNEGMVDRLYFPYKMRWKIPKAAKVENNYFHKII